MQTAAGCAKTYAPLAVEDYTRALIQCARLYSRELAISHDAKFAWCPASLQLAGFLGSTLPYIDMDVSKKDRQHIHKQCEALELMGIRLNHTSEGEGRKRCLRVSRVEAGGVV